MRRRAAAIGVALMLVVVSPAAAQTPAATPAAKPTRDREFSVGGLIGGPTSMGSSDAVLLGSSGQPTVVLFSTENRQASAFGPGVLLGFRLRTKLWFEIGLGLTRASTHTRITNDFEGAPDTSVAATVTRVSGDAALLWIFRERAGTSWFLRGAGGLISESSGELIVAKQGVTATGGLGLKHWWRTNRKGTIKRIGLRADFIGQFRAGGISLGQRSFSFGPAGAVHLVFAY